jgi:predicted phage tail protein
MVLGEDFVVWMLLALGAAMFLGNIMAVIKPRQVRQADSDLDAAPRGRSIAMAVLGLVVALAALGSLIAG